MIKEVYIHTNDGFIRLKGIIDIEIKSKDNIKIKTRINTQAELLLFGIFNKFSIDKYQEMSFFKEDSSILTFSCKVSSIKESIYSTTFDIEVKYTDNNFLK